MNIRPAAGWLQKWCRYCRHFSCPEATSPYPQSTASRCLFNYGTICARLQGALILRFF